ncbi:unnamed protein product [Pleuronectes platessa]|uniref:Uncharacterized protein n=1 Tax=Pleuronectes platessa TaxID=8262 RepID=A0A9N7TMX4_PLEPL|nr:unnamed protein product [Pleuronectes platessa]
MRGEGRRQKKELGSAWLRRLRNRRRRRVRVSSVLWCIVGRRLQLPCRCAAWLTQRLAGSQSQRREAVPLQFSVSERTEEARGEDRRKGIGRCQDNERREQGEMNEGGMKSRWGERDERWRWNWEEGGG